MTGIGAPTYSLKYAAGSGRLLAGEKFVVLVPAQTAPVMVDELWSAVQAGDALAAAACVLTARLEGAVLLVFRDGGARVLLRGAAVLVEPSEESSHGEISFREIDLDASRVVARLGADAVPCDLPLAAGVVGALAFEWSALKAPATGPHHTEAAQSSKGDEPRDAVQASNLGSIADAYPDPGPEAEAALAPVEQVLAPAALEVALDPTRTLSSEDLERFNSVVETNVEVPAVDPESPGPADSYDRLFGATSLFTSRAQPPTSVSDAPETALESHVAEEPLSPSALESPVSSATSEAPRDGGSLIDGVPAFLRVGGAVESLPHEVAAPSNQPPPEPVAPTTALQHPTEISELTVARPPKGAPIAAQMLIQAVHCPHGHPNPSESVTCRLCGVEVPNQSSVTVPRPPLGALVGVEVPQGAPARIELDRSVVLGRKPFVDEVTSSVPRLVVVDSPDGGISRQHAKVALDGWHVLVADLGSRYGTVVQLPGEDPLLLHPNSPVMVTPGTIVTLAEVVTYRFEVQP